MTIRAKLLLTMLGIGCVGIAISSYIGYRYASRGLTERPASADRRSPLQGAADRNAIRHLVEPRDSPQRGPHADRGDG